VGWGGLDLGLGNGRNLRRGEFGREDWRLDRRLSARRTGITHISITNIASIR